ncbi:MAG TPA: cofactor-independent phosphoglycerate mutase [Methanobacteriales archaeon]|nr:MAG: 2,3-bisphosphoglycerate-independent phosphoglycerate mutase [Methanobacteriaceae archaeon 41_258]MBC7089759.1 cofactor-independent phosphoglycerate mutase [Methanobacteriaceae archaeon]MBC7096353.1 cofactor-independent phosphoglycerate mutase [Methanobacteriales archaeon]HIH62518.1 cofactor-independent phosphoglycerate mutase [Methanobacteriales archaeon]
MKYVILIGDGMADYPIPELGDKTPLQVAEKPNMDQVAKEGANGLLKTIPNDMEPGSDVANLAIMGYNPKKYYTGRGPLEAASIGVELKEDDIAFRCNFITVHDGRIIDFNANHISTSESSELIKTLNEHFKIGKFYTGISYRNLYIYPDKRALKVKTKPPHDIIGEPIEYHLPSNGETAKKLKQIITESHRILKDHPTNIERSKRGKLPANMIWLWGQGQKPRMETLKEKYGLKGATITGVDLIKGLGVYLGLDNINVPGATGYLDTDYKAKGKYAIKALQDHDIIFIHVEAPDEAGHAGDIKEKIKAIENIDSKILGPLLDELPSYNSFRLALLADHPTPIKVGTHTPDPVPYAICGENVKKDNIRSYDEESAKKGRLGISVAWKLLNKLIGS